MTFKCPSIRPSVCPYTHPPTVVVVSQKCLSPIQQKTKKNHFLVAYTLRTKITFLFFLVARIYGVFSGEYSSSSNATNFDGYNIIQFSLRNSTKVALLVIERKIKFTEIFWIMKHKNKTYQPLFSSPTSHNVIIS